MIITKLVISGGGINGIAILGGINELFKYNKKDNIKEILCVSVGSIIGLLIVLGYNSDELKNIFTEIKLNDFMDYKVKRFIDNWGFDDGIMNKKLLKAMLINKKYNPNITFIDLYNKTNIELIITGTNLTKGITEYFNYKTYPHMEVIDAIRISCSYPVIYTPVKYNNCLYVDGGVLEPYPIDYFEDLSGVLGFVIDYVIEEDKEINIKTFDKYYLTLIKTIINKNEYNKIQNFKNNTVIINKKNLHNNVMDYNLSDDYKNTLYKAGCDSFLDFYLSNNI